MFAEMIALKFCRGVIQRCKFILKIEQRPK